MTNPYAPAALECQLFLKQKKELRKRNKKDRISRAWPFINNWPGQNVFLATKVTYPE